MNLISVVNIFHKLAQQLQPQVLNERDRILYLNHIIRVNRECDLMLPAVAAQVKAGILRPEAQRHVQSMKNLAVRLTGLVINTADLSNLKQVEDLYKLLAGEYDTIENNYIGKEYKHMKNIRDSLVFIYRFIQKQKGVPSSII